ncbi:MAG: hypothetical protein AAF642_01535 [Pseudomonadota bacterium]
MMTAKLKTVSRWLLAGPGTLIAAVLAMGGSTQWLPAGPAEIDNFLYPVLLFPGIWAIFFFIAIMFDHVWKAALLIFSISAVHAYLVFTAFSAG